MLLHILSQNYFIIEQQEEYNFIKTAMSSPTINKQQPIVSTQKKSVTASFQLQTKIRLIIQQVLAATIRKLALFGEKMQRFQQYFITFKERFQTVERQRNRQQQQMNKISQMQTNIRRDINFNEIKATQQRQRNAIQFKQSRDEFFQIQKILKSLTRQNENINAQLSKTKAKFLEYSNTITTLKQEVSWKITKYLQETAESHTQMKVFAQGIKIQNFNMNLLIEKQKQKYDQIILKYQEDLVFRHETTLKLDQLNKQNGNRMADIAKLNAKIDDIQFSVLSKLKNTDVKFQDKLKQLDKNNSKLTNVFKKIDNFNDLLDNIRNEVEQNKMNFQKKNDQMKKFSENIKEEVTKVSKQNAKLQKVIEKKIAASEQKTEKLQDFLLQKIQFAKMEIESEMSNKTSKMIQQKAKNDQSVSNSTVDQINSRISRMQLETTKNLNKIQNTLKEQIVETRRQIQKTKVEIETQLEQTIQNVVSSAPKHPGEFTGGGSGISSKQVGMINGQINLIKESFRSSNIRIEALQNLKAQLQKANTDLARKVDDHFIESEEKINTKIQKVMFLVTKMRGDSIMRNQFNQKQIKELKKMQNEFRERMQTTWKIIPGMGQCINLVLALIFDAEYQHSKIIQDNLPVLAKDAEKFNTCCQGILYEFKQKKKPGTICYRHVQIKKTDLVRATFNGYIHVWEQIYEAEFKNKQHLLPKGFYKKVVEKAMKTGGKPTSEKDLLASYSSNQVQQHSSLQQMRNSSNAPQSITRIEGFSQIMNSSFHIRKKKTIIKQKQEASHIQREDHNIIRQ